MDGMENGAPGVGGTPVFLRTSLPFFFFKKKRGQPNPTMGVCKLGMLFVTIPPCFLGMAFNVT